MIWHREWFANQRTAILGRSGCRTPKLVERCSKWRSIYCVPVSEFAVGQGGLARAQI